MLLVFVGFFLSFDNIDDGRGGLRLCVFVIEGEGGGKDDFSSRVYYALCEQREIER